MTNMYWFSDNYNFTLTLLGNAHAFGEVTLTLLGNAHAFREVTLTLLGKYAHAFGEVRSRFWGSTLTLLGKYAHAFGEVIFIDVHIFF